MKNAHILLIEDNEGDILMTLEAFEESEMSTNISIARNGREALDFLHRRNGFEKSKKVDLILLDINLPIYNGHELLQMIKNDHQLKLIPTIILTTSANPSDIKKAYENHANSYVTKPTELNDFLNAIFRIEKFWLRTCKLA